MSCRRARRVTGICVREVVLKKYENQSSTTTTVVDESVAALTASEERILRMRSGASLGPDAALESKLSGYAGPNLADLQARLALIEAEALAALQGDGLAPDSARKSRIIAALKDKSSD